MRRDRSPSSINDSVGSLLRLANILTRDLAPLFERSNITPQQWMLLTTLSTIDGSPTLAGLARHMMVSKQNVTGMIRRLEETGLVRKTDDPEDLRSSRVALTRKGAELLTRMRPQYREWIDSFLGRLTANDRQAFDRSLAILVGEPPTEDEKTRG